MGWSRAAVVRVAGVVAAGTVLALALLPFATRLPNFVVPDDGYFYARIAYELARHHRSTFDGVHTTSGYHLPWAFALAAVSKLLLPFTHGVRAHLGAHLALACMVGLATSLRFFQRAPFRICAFVVFLATFSLTEMAIAIPVLLALLDGVTKRPSRAEAWLALALPLVRVDLVCAPIAVGAVLALRERRRASVLIGAGVLGALLQMGIMQAVFDEPFGVAAFLKVSTRVGVLDQIRWNVGEGSFAAFGYAAHLGLAGLALSFRNARSTWAMLAGALVFLAMHTCLSTVRPWYWAPGWLGLLFVLERTVDAPHARRATLAAGALTLAFVAHSVRSQVVYAEDQRGASRMLAEIEARVPAGATLFTFDNPGFLGFFSGHDVIDGDGLVNDYAYARRLLGGRLAGYLDEERVCYVVVDHVDDDPILDLSGLVVRREDAVPLFAIRRSRTNQADFALYRLRAPRCAP